MAFASAGDFGALATIILGTLCAHRWFGKLAARKNLAIAASRALAGEVHAEISGIKTVFAAR